MGQNSSKKTNSKINSVQNLPSLHEDSFLSDMKIMHSRMDELFNSFWNNDPFFSRPLFPLLRSADTRLMVPHANFVESDKEVRAEVEIPGVEKKDITLNITDDRVEIKAEKKHEQKQESKDSFHVSRSYSGFYRSFALPKNVDASKAKAKYENGVLRISIPKSKSPGTKSRSLTIE